VRRDLVDATQIDLAQMHVERVYVLLQVLAAFSAGDRDDIVALREHPGERELRGRAALFFGQLFNTYHKV
jgi:hypothetical protein